MKIMDEKTKERLILEAQSSASSVDPELTVRHLWNVFEISSPKLGSVSLSYEDRCWAPGVSQHPKSTSLTFRDRGGKWQGEPLWGFTGRGWWKKMVETSLRALKKGNE